LATRNYTPQTSYTFIAKKSHPNKKLPFKKILKTPQKNPPHLIILPPKKKGDEN
jgi:hypothetical protein